MPEECPHGNATITGGGPYYRQVHPNNFQDGRVLSPAFVLHDTGCHLTLSLNDGARTTAECCHREFTEKGRQLSAAVVSISTDELAESGAERVVDSPNEQTHAHVDAMYDQPLSRRQRRNVAQSLVIAANKKVPAYFPPHQTPRPDNRSSEIASLTLV